jgi:hypothetical protein
MAQAAHRDVGHIRALPGEQPWVLLPAGTSADESRRRTLFDVAHHDLQGLDASFQVLTSIARPVSCEEGEGGCGGRQHNLRSFGIEEPR